MASMENVIRGLEYHLKELSVGKTCFECPYWGNNPCEIHLISEALELLKEQDKTIEQVEDDLARTENMLNHYLNGNE